MVVQLPVGSAFGTDEDFDLRALLEQELTRELAWDGAGECGRGVIENGRMSIHLEAVADHLRTLHAVKDVLARLKLLSSASVVLETRFDADPDEVNRQLLWPVHSTPARVA
jgi:hypothetical protein